MTDTDQKPPSDVDHLKRIRFYSGCLVSIGVVGLLLLFAIWNAITALGLRF